LADPARPVWLSKTASGQFGWGQIAGNGSGLGLAVVGIQNNAKHDVSVYDLSNPRTNNVFLTSFVTPGNAQAAAIYNGLAYVADERAGLEVINYLPYDSKGVPPTIALETSFPASGAEGGALMRVTANARDDVQVNNVEFYLDGAKT